MNAPYTDLTRQLRRWLMLLAALYVLLATGGRPAAARAGPDRLLSTCSSFVLLL